MSVLLNLMIALTVRTSKFGNFILIAWIEGFAIFLAVFVVATVGSWNDYKKEE